MPSPTTPRVDFYILPHDDIDQYHRFICRLVHKIYRLSQSLFIRVDNIQQAEHWDALLWTFQPDSFIAHGIDQPQLPVCIAQSYQKAVDVCLNLATTPLDQSTQTQRCLEIIDQQPDHLQQGRQRFKCYQQQDWAIETHKL